MAKATPMNAPIAMKSMSFKSLLFEPWDPFAVDTIKSEIYNCLTRLEPRIKVTGVGLRDDSEINSVQIGIDYTIVGESETQNVEFLLERA